MPAKVKIAVDFDGVLHSYTSGWKGPVPTDPPVEGAKEFIEFLVNQGYDAIIHSTRADTREGLIGTKQWLADHGFPMVAVQAVKPKAILYVDDRGFRFEGPASFPVLQELLTNPEEAKDRVEPWNKKI